MAAGACARVAKARAARGRRARLRGTDCAGRLLDVGEDAQQLERCRMRTEAPEEVLPVLRVGEGGELRESERRARKYLLRLLGPWVRVRVRVRVG